MTGYAINQSNGALQAVGEIFDASSYGLPVAKASPLAESLRQAVMHLIRTREYRDIMDKWGVEAGMITAPVINGAFN